MVRSTQRSTLRHAGAGSLIGLWASITLSRFQVATGFSSDINCPTETVFCIADADCSTCLETLQTSGISIDSDFDECTELFSNVCATVADSGCDVDNTFLQNYAACAAEQTYGCPGFTNCADASQDAPGTPAPAAEPTTPPTAVASPAPTAMSAAGEGSGDTIAPSSDLSSSATPSPSGADDVLEAGEASGAAHTVAGATELALALTFGVALTVVSG